MNKPFSMVYEEFRLNLINLINNSGLTASVMEPVLQNCLNEVSSIARKQYQIDKEQYEKSLLENNMADVKDIKNEEKKES